MSTGSTRCAEPRAASPVHDSSPHFHCPVSLEELRRRHSTLSVACPAAGLRLWRKGVHLPEDLGILLAVPLRQARQGAPRHQARAGQGPRRWVAPPRPHLPLIHLFLSYHLESKDVYQCHGYCRACVSPATPSPLLDPWHTCRRHSQQTHRNGCTTLAAPTHFSSVPLWSPSRC